MVDISEADAQPRDFVGYGASPPDPKWPNGAKVAISFVLNYEEGSESCILEGDTQSECLLTDIVGMQPVKGARHLNVESLYEYGSRVGVWRVLKLFKRYGHSFTSFACAQALERNPSVAKAMLDDGHEISSHGYRWLDYQNSSVEKERDHIRKAVAVQTKVAGVRPLGLYQGKTSIQTQRLAMEEGGFVYLNDNYSDDLPFYRSVPGFDKPALIMPYTLDVNDMKFCVMNGFVTAQQFFEYLRDAVDYLLEEDSNGTMMSVGLHCRIVGHPARAKGLKMFFDYLATLGARVWVAKRIDIAQHWLSHHPPGASN